MGILDSINPKKGQANDAPLSLPDIIAPAAVNLGSKSLNISGKLCRIFFAVSYPRFLTDGWL